jgi:hypothetical protein
MPRRPAEPSRRRRGLSLPPQSESRGCFTAFIAAAAITIYVLDLAANPYMMITQWWVPSRPPLADAIIATRRLEELNGTEIAVLSREPRVEIIRSFLSAEQMAHVLGLRDQRRALSLKAKDTNKYLFLDLKSGAPAGEHLAPGTIAATGDEVLSDVEKRIASWVGADVHPHATDLLLTFSTEDGLNEMSGDFRRFNARTDDLHVDTSGDYMNCASVLIYLNDAPIEAGTVFPCLPKGGLQSHAESDGWASRAAHCKAAGEELLQQPPFDIDAPKRDGVRFTKWARERKMGQALSPSLTTIWEAAAVACDSDGPALRVVPEAGMALMWQHRDCLRPTWVAELASQRTPPSSDYRTFHARCLQKGGFRSTLQKFIRPTREALLKYVQARPQAQDSDGSSSV